MTCPKLLAASAIASPFMQMIDPAAGTVAFWGDGQTAIDLTSMDDTAAFLAKIVCDPAILNRVVQVVSEELSMSGIAQAYQEATGRALTLHPNGSLEQGHAELGRLKADDADLMRVLPLPMVSGKAKLRNVENRRYPQITPTRLTHVLRAEQNR